MPSAFMALRAFFSLLLCLPEALESLPKMSVVLAPPTFGWDSSNS
jgi:hypothetical protein